MGKSRKRMKRGRESGTLAARIRQTQRTLVKEAATCLVCTVTCPPRYVLKKLEDGGRQGAKTCEKFLIQDILAIPTEEFVETYKDLQPIYSFISLCLSCRKFVDEIAEVTDQIAKAKRRLDLMNQNLRQKIEVTARFQEVEFGQEEQGVLHRLARDIRQRACGNSEGYARGRGRTGSGMFLRTGVWSSSAAVADDVLNFGNLRQDDGDYDTNIFSPDVQIRESGIQEDLLYEDPAPEEDDDDEVSSFDEDGDVKPVCHTEVKHYSRNSSNINVFSDKPLSIGSRTSFRLRQKPRKNVVEKSVGSSVSRRKKGKFPCGICETIFTSPFECNEHRENIHPGLAVCLELSDNGRIRCNKVFRAVDLNQHKHESHIQYQCPACICEFPTIRLLGLHIQNRHPGTLIPLDDQEDNSPEDDWIHPLTKTEIKNLSVNDTDIISDVGGNIKVEETADKDFEEEDCDFPEFDHDPENVIIDSSPCRICNAVCSTDNELADHMKLVHRPVDKIVSFKCSVCTQAFSDQQSLMSHFISNHNKNVKVACYVCKMTFKTVEECGAHITKVHPKERGLGNDKISNEVTNGSESQVAFKCDKCTAVLASRDGLTEHVRTHHAGPQRRYKCRKCYVRCFTLEGLKRHEKSHRIRVEKKKSLKPTGISKKLPFPCLEPNCAAQFTLKWLLTMHNVKVHNIPKPKHVCDFCQKTFKWASSLQRHRMGHTGEMPFECTVCGMRFSKDTLLLYHSRAKHTNERPFPCKICSKRFTSKNFLNRHVIIHSEDKPYLCSLCGKTFKTRNNLYIHGWSHDPDRKTKYSLYMPKEKREALINSRKLKRLQKVPVTDVNSTSNIDSQNNPAMSISVPVTDFGTTEDVSINNIAVEVYSDLNTPQPEMGIGHFSYQSL